MLESLRPHIRPFQKPHPPIGVAGVSAGSETLKVAGERGFLPMSLNLNQTYVASHWASVEEGARRTGRTPSRADWRLVREIFVADTDEEAWRLSVGAQMGRMMREYFLPLLKNVGVIQYLKHDDAVADSDVTPEYCATHNWLIGSPATVVEKIERMYEEVGGFGQLLLFCFDYSENPQAVAAFDGIAGAGGDAESRAPAADPKLIGMIPRRPRHGIIRVRRYCCAGSRSPPGPIRPGYGAVKRQNVPLFAPMK